MSIEGELEVTVTCDAREVRAVNIRSGRPRFAARMLRGRTPDEGVEILARAFSLCGAAQGSAAGSAVDAARGREGPDSVVRARVVAVRLEAVQEHCLRLALDWPRAMHESPLIDFARGVRRALATPLQSAMQATLRAADLEAVGCASAALRAVAELATAHLLGMTPAAWLALDHAGALDGWCATRPVAPARWYARLQRQSPALGASEVGLMPIATRAVLRTSIAPRLRDPHFALAPDWDGVPVETGALARMSRHPLIASLIAQSGQTVAVRLIARLTELARWLVASDAFEPSSHACEGFAEGAAGIGIAETARGLLAHRVVLMQGRIADYGIVAPTDWNFRAGGAFAQAIRALHVTSDADLMHEVGLVAQAIDPCVACRTEIRHA